MAEDNKVTQNCVVCFERPSGTRLQPCGHDYFCRHCAERFRTCPLCRSHIDLDASFTAWLDRGSSTLSQTPQQETPSAQQPVISRKEGLAAAIVCATMYLFIFGVGWLEFISGVPCSCAPGDPRLDPEEAARIGQEAVHMSNACRSQIGECCFECKEGFFNFGHQCFRYLENLPPFRVGAMLGGYVYFALIVVTQVVGILSELILVRRLMKRRLMPRKELIVIAAALLLEVLRMFLVDVFMLQEYFGDHDYYIFRAPVRCNRGREFSWTGADGHNYCSSNDLPGEETAYFIATSKNAFSSNEEVCSTWLPSSALLNFRRSSSKLPDAGAPRFENIGWIIGGEFALYYLFATFINELADVMFIVPTTTAFGWRCKVASVVLEVVQLGALCPAAIFSHGDCLHYNNPLNASLHLISLLVVAFGYGVWASMIVAPVTLLGSLFLAHLFKCVGGVSDRMCKLFGGNFINYWERAVRAATGGAGLGASVLLVLAFWPILLGGTFLGVLVVIGQASKSGPMSVLTALVLLGDVLLKVGATIITEVADYLLHRRVSRAVRQRGGNFEATPIGLPASSLPSAP